MAVVPPPKKYRLQAHQKQNLGDLKPYSEMHLSDKNSMSLEMQQDAEIAAIRLSATSDRELNEPSTSAVSHGINYK